MHYFKFDIEKWVQSTRHLLPEEEGIYIRLINHYYDIEQPLPIDNRMMLKRLQLLSFQASVDEILDEYFEKTDKGWIHKKCDTLIKNYRKTRKTNRDNGRKGGRPSKDAPPSESENKPDGFTEESEQEPEAKAISNYELGTTNYELPKETAANAAVSDAAAEPVENKPRAKPIPYQKIINLFHEHCPMLPKVVTITSGRKTAIRSRWQGGMNTREFWENYFKHVAESDFLTGKKTPIPPRTKPMIADIDFLLRESTIAFMQEGKYDD
jgi:uncharacterized protein YdaU (DUF1376 family)